MSAFLSNQARTFEFIAKTIKGLLIAAVGLIVVVIFQPSALAQEQDPLALAKTNIGYEAAKSTKLMGEEFSGTWRVSHTDKSDQAWHGRAIIAKDGSAIDLNLTGPDGEVAYELLEAEVLKYEGDDGPFKAMMTARFKRIRKSMQETDDQSPPEIADDMRIFLPLDHDLITFKKGDIELDLSIVWADRNLDYIRIDLHSREEGSKFEGKWMEERGGEFKGGGAATWIRGGLTIDGVIVLDDQLGGPGMKYPFAADGSKIKHLRTKRTLVVFGKNLPEYADGADIQSQSDFISFFPVFDTGSDRDRLIAKAFAKAKVTPVEDLDAFLVEAHFNEKGVLPGTKILTVDGQVGSWPLVFANQFANIQFTRGTNDPTPNFYIGDVGYIELTLNAAIPYKEFSVRLLRGLDKPIKVGDLTAKPIVAELENPQTNLRVFRTNAIHLIDYEVSSLRPPLDKKALSVSASNGMVLQSQLVDRVELLTSPSVARVDIVEQPGLMGGMWDETLDRVAQCYSETINDYDKYQLEEATRVEAFIIHELALQVIDWGDLTNARANRNVPLLKGDHAAAILLRDEYITASQKPISMFKGLTSDKQAVRGAMNITRENEAYRDTSFWQDSIAIYIEQGVFWDSNHEMPLVAVLYPEDIAERFDISIEEAQLWAEQQVTLAAAEQIKKLGEAINKSLEGGDCDLGQLLAFAGHKSIPLVNRILPRLVELKKEAGPPETQHWVEDKMARAFVRSLYISGDAVRAMEDYASSDKYAVVAYASAAIGLAARPLMAGGQYVAGVLAGSTSVAADIGLGLYDVNKYYEGEDFYSFARTAQQVMGDDIVADALAGQQNPMMTAVGVILPMIAGASSVKHLNTFKNQLRNIENVNLGRALLSDNPNILDDLASLKDADRIAMASYYNDVVSSARNAGLNTLDETDRAAFDVFDEFTKGNTPNPQLAETIDEAVPNTVSALDDTIDQAPAFVDPRLNPGGRSLYDIIRDAPIDDSPPLVIPRTGLAGDLMNAPPGSLSQHLTNDEVTSLFNRFTVTPDEVLIKADLIRSGRVPLSVAQGDPEVLRALDEVFGRQRNHPSVTPGGTIIDAANPATSSLDDTVTVSMPGVSTLDDTVILPPKTNLTPLDGTPSVRSDETVILPRNTTGSTLEDTVIEPGHGGGNSLPDTVVEGGPNLADTVIEAHSPSSFDPNVTVPPTVTESIDTVVGQGGTGANPVGPIRTIVNEDLAAQMEVAHRDEMANYVAGIRGSEARLSTLRKSHEWLSMATPEQLMDASEIDSVMRLLGADNYGAMTHSAVMYPQVSSASITDYPGALGPKMTQAQIVAEGLLLHGRRPVSLAEFAKANGVTQTAARLVLERVFSRSGVPKDANVLLPLNFSR